MKTLILAYLVGFLCGIVWWHLGTRRKRHRLFLVLFLIIVSIIAIAWGSTYGRWPLSSPFWIGWPPGYGSIPETALIGINLFSKPLVIVSYGTPYGAPYSLVILEIFLYMIVIDATAVFLGLATVSVLYTCWKYLRR